MGKQASSHGLWGTGSCHIFGFTQLLEVSGAALWDQRGKVCPCSHAHTASGRPCVCLCDVIPCLHLSGCVLLILGTQRERAPREPTLCYLGQRPPCCDPFFLHIHPVRGSWCQVLGERGFLIQTQALQVESGLQRTSRGFRPRLCRGCCLSFSLFRGRCICPRPVQEALYLQECEGACDSLGRRLSPQTSPTAGPP